MPKKPKAKPEKSESELIIEQLTSDLQRLQADFINYKNRAEKERTEALKLGRELSVSELLPVFDNLERAFAHTPDELKDNNWVKGINGLERQLLNVLSDLGLKKIETIGRPFDPSLMEAVGIVDADAPAEAVIEELQAGYTLDGKVLRPAMVKISK